MTLYDKVRVSLTMGHKVRRPLRTGSRSLPLLLILGLLSCRGASLAEGECSTDGDCGAGQVCLGGACTTPGVGAACSAPEDCPADQSCNFETGRCEGTGPASCTGDADCANGQTCDLANGVCADPVAPMGTPCSDDSGCGENMVCEGQQCVLACSQPGTSIICPDTAGCDPDSGRCKTPSVTCNSDIECGAPIGVCMNNQCVAGCGQPDGITCTGGNSCDGNTGRCAGADSCGTDMECGAPAGICQAGRCIPGCAQAGGDKCMSPEVCDSNVGRCVSVQGPCGGDADCGPPNGVCEFGQCVPGCGQLGGLQCTGATACNPGSGRCEAGGPFCASDTECNAPQEICNLLNGLCEPGCSLSGCTGGETCRPSGHCSTGGCTDDLYEPNNSAAAATDLAPGNYAALTVCEANDDFYKLTLAGGDIVDISVLFSHADGDVNIEVLNPQSTIVASGVSNTDNETVSFTAATAGDYMLRVFLVTDLGPNDGNTYSLDMALSCGDDRFEPNNSEATPSNLLPGVESGLSLCPSDEDYYAVQLQAGQEISVDVRFIDADGDIDLRLIDPAGGTAASSGSTSDNESLTHVAAQSGTYLIRVWLFSDSGASPGNRYELEVSIAQGPPPMTCMDDGQEDNDTALTASAISPGNVPNLQLCSGDDDFFQLSLASGESLTLDVSFAHSEGNIDVQLRDSSGLTVASALSTTDNETLSYTAPSAGTYTIRLFLAADSGATPGNAYSLDLAVGSAPSCTADRFEPNDSTTQAASVLAGTQTGLTLCPSDQDYFALSLAAGDQVTVTTNFTHAEGDIDLELLGSTGTRVTSSQSTSDNESLSYTVTTAGTYYIRAWLYRDQGSVSGNSFDLDVQITPAAPASCSPDAMESNNAPAEAILLSPTTSMANLTACPTDDDWYAVDLLVGELISVDVSFTHGEGDIDIGLYDPNGTLVAAGQSTNDNETISYSVVTSGFHWLVVILYNDLGSVPGNGYNLNASF